MKNALFVALILLTFVGCKKEEEKKVVKAPVAIPVEELVARSGDNQDDWGRDIKIYMDTILTCTNAAPVQAKYVFRADAFETPSVTLVLFKAEDDQIYACTQEEMGAPPHFKIIKAAPDPKAARFYPGALPKADSCLENTRITDQNGRTAGWMSKITC